MMDKSMSIKECATPADLSDYVEVMFAKSASEAQDLVRFLQESQVPAQLENSLGLTADCGVAILVPSERFVEASEILATRVHGKDDIDDEPLDDSNDDLEDLDEEDDDAEDDEFDDDDDDDFDDDDEEEAEDDEV